MTRIIAIKPTFVRRILILAGLVMPLAGCGLKGDLYFPEPQTQAEEDAIKTDDSELDSEDQRDGTSN
jgi:predicted small lipoprotein YifL